LLQYRANKSKRLDELEQKAREFEVLENVNLHKMLQMMDKKEKRITSLERQEMDQNVALDKLMQVANSKVRRAQEKADLERVVKEEAINKLLELKHQTSLVKTVDDHMTSDYWKEKHDVAVNSLLEAQEKN
jgi:hypothetical protein